MGLLRFLLAVSVILAHAGKLFGFEFVGGRIAVETFFMISGFYITLILNEKYIKANNSYKLFITNRFLRLYPLYWVALILTLVCAAFIPNYTANSYMGNLGSWAAYGKSLSFSSCAFLVASNILLFFQDVIYFLGADLKSGLFFFTSNFYNTKPPLVYTFSLIPQAWSISLELMFYLIAPFIVKRKYIIIIALIVASAALKTYFMAHGLNNDPWVYRFFPFELMFFLLGTLSYYLYRKVKDVKIPKYIYPALLVFISLFTIFFSFISVTFFTYRIYIVAVFLSMPFLFNYTKKFKLDKFIGELSYPIYITHMLVFNTVKALGITQNLQLITILTTIILSIILVKLIGDPIERLRQARVKDQKGVDKVADALSVKLLP